MPCMIKQILLHLFHIVLGASRDSIQAKPVSGVSNRSTAGLTAMHRIALHSEHSASIAHLMSENNNNTEKATAYMENTATQEDIQWDTDSTSEMKGEPIS